MNLYTSSMLTNNYLFTLFAIICNYQFDVKLILLNSNFESDK